MQTKLTQRDLSRLLAALANEDAEDEILGQMEVAYPMSYDPATGVLILPEAN